MTTSLVDTFWYISDIEEKKIIPQETSRSLTDLIIGQINTPSGNDATIGAFYQAFMNFLEMNHPCALDLTDGIKNIRKITPALHVNLLFRAFQSRYIKDPNYPSNYHKVSDWENVLDTSFQNEQEFKYIKNIIIEKDTTTTVYQRYVGENAMMSKLSQGRPVKVLDIGCGGNYGTPGMQLHIPFLSIADQSGVIDITDLEALNLEEGWAVDKENPYDSTAIDWRHACGFYPNEIENGQLQKTIAFEKQIANPPKIYFNQGDFLSPSIHVPSNYFDFAILNTILYQLSPDEQYIFIQKARTHLKDNGVLFIQDFAKPDRKQPSGLSFDGINWGERGSYKLFLTHNGLGDQIFHAASFDGGRCKEIMPGVDYEYIQSWSSSHLAIGKES